jgi:NAD-dependent SIR2 family protein deacetylase
MRNEKTVYILGAGASKTIGLPLQGELLNCIFMLEPRTLGVQASFMQLEYNINEQRLLSVYKEFTTQRTKLSDFIVSNFASKSLRAEYWTVRSVINGEDELPEVKPRYLSIASRVNVTLEDLFTLFDKIIIGRENFRIYSPEIIQEVHTALRKCIIFTLAYYSSVSIPADNSIRKFSEKLVEFRRQIPAPTDKFSIITMNWDAYLEKALFQICEETNKVQPKRKVYPDLCFYDYCYNPDEHRIVSTQIKAKGHRNIKLLKLHGSINWLSCPYCGRVFVDYRQDIAMYEMYTECYCPLCYNEFERDMNSPQLHSMLITPTFLKDLNNLHIKNIWHNALIDLTEATKVVFIGYSFPDADFEMRCLLKKALKPETEIDVVLHSTDDPKYYEEILSGQSSATQILPKLNLPEGRYVSFFGSDMIKFHYCGMEEYLDKNFPGEVAK